MSQNKITRGVDTKVWVAALVCFVGALFYFYDFFLQSLPGIISLRLISDLKIGAGALGLLSGAYFFTYTPMQLVAGLLYDRYGPRILLTIMISVCGIGAILFGFAHGLIPALSRLMSQKTFYQTT
jgi:sugar phosphate permease